MKYLKIGVLSVIGLTGSLRQSFFWEGKIYKILSTKSVETHGKTLAVQNGLIQFAVDSNQQDLSILTSFFIFLKQSKKNRMNSSLVSWLPMSLKYITL